MGVGTEKNLSRLGETSGYKRVEQINLQKKDHR
jgi:hypothetical protein